MRLTKSLALVRWAGIARRAQDSNPLIGPSGSASASPDTGEVRLPSEFPNGRIAPGSQSGKIWINSIRKWTTSEAIRTV